MLPTKIDAASLKTATDEASLSAAYKALTKASVYKPIVVEGPDTKEPVSKYFGVPWLTAGEDWPVLHGEKATFVLQLDVASLPKAQSDLLGGTGLVQLFYETTGAGDWDDSSLVRLVQPAGALSACVEEVPRPAENPSWVMKLITSWEEDSDYPRFEHLQELTGEDLEDVGEDLETEPSESLDECLQGDKLGGWPYWSQAVEPPTDSKGETMLYVMQIDAGCFYDGRQFPAHAEELFAGDGTGRIFVSATDPSELKFHWACG